MKLKCSSAPIIHSRILWYTRWIFDEANARIKLPDSAEGYPNLPKDDTVGSQLSSNSSCAQGEESIDTGSAGIDGIVRIFWDS